MNEECCNEELLALERKYWKAIQDKDVDAALALTDDPCIIAGARGVATVDRGSFIKIMKSAPYTLHGFEVKDDAQVRYLTSEIALIAYNVHEDLTVDGKPVSLDASDTSIWVHRKDGWLCAMHSEAVRGDPYGRDKRP